MSLRSGFAIQASEKCKKGGLQLQIQPHEAVVGGLLGEAVAFGIGIGVRPEYGAFENLQIRAGQDIIDTGAETAEPYGAAFGKSGGAGIPALEAARTGYEGAGIPDGRVFEEVHDGGFAFVIGSRFGKVIQVAGDQKGSSFTEPAVPAVVVV